MGTYVLYYCPLKKQQVRPGDVNGLSNGPHYQPSRTDIGRLLIHLLSGYGGLRWLAVAMVDDGSPWNPETGLPDYDTVREYEDVTRAAIASYNECWPEAEPLAYCSVLTPQERAAAEQVVVDVRRNYSRKERP